ncbi:DUF6266 family protein [Pedobacter mucosus]|uniref:DUF6266 family protein n=1 Tax=Pedobacter mucosus TaxID=2895286 RepID=UPI001EE4329B|nr:DUF6266 family protein [Pedobacter mucosus]UKT63261.1 DUF6266 family protein [Pedobacter mucosus]
MGIIKNGANGGFSGKAGSVIGSNWNNISYIKGLYKKNNKPATLKQLEQRLRFATVVNYLSPIKDVLNLGYKGQTGNRVTGFNMGVQYALLNAVNGVYPSFAVDRSLIQISKGTLSKPSDIVLTSTVPAQLTIDWSTNGNTLNAFADDNLFAVSYNSQQDFFSISTNFSERGLGTGILSLPANFSGQEVEVYLFYSNRDNTRRSVSTYAGPVIIA